MSKKTYSNQQKAGAAFIIIAAVIAIYSALDSKPNSSTLTNIQYATFALGIVLMTVGRKKKTNRA